MSLTIFYKRCPNNTLQRERIWRGLPNLVVGTAIYKDPIKEVRSTINKIDC